MDKRFFDLTGMTCSACSSRIEKTVGGLEGVREVSVNLLNNRMAVVFDGHALTAEDIARAVREAGYGASVQGSDTARPARSARRDAMAGQQLALKRRLIVSILFTLLLCYVSMGSMAGLPMPAFLTGPLHTTAFALTQLVLTLPVLIANFRFFRVGFKTLIAGRPNMDSLIALGSGAAVAFGVYSLCGIVLATWRGDMAAAHQAGMNLYFESAAMILTLITLGKWLEERAKGKTSDAIAKLMNLVPQTARVVREGREQIIPAQEVQVGERVIVKAGESVPVDGVIEEGSACLDESALTGESVPVEKQAGDAVSGATINQSGHFVMCAMRVGEDTTLAQIVKLVDEAASSKAPIARLADRISGVFVPVVIAIALAATAVWLLLGQDVGFAVTIGISVLVISCPCALGLATPTAIMVGVGRAAAHGILFKSAQAIETAGAVKTVVLDKTGTVTEGKPVLTEIMPCAGVTENELLAMMASLEQLSEHPLGQAVVREAHSRKLKLKQVRDFRQTPGIGIGGTIDNGTCLAGNIRLLEHMGIWSDEFREALAAQGKTILYFILNGELLGRVAVADVIKPHSRRAVHELESMGLGVVMLTGDHARTAAAIADQAGIRQVIAEVLPQDKEARVRELQEQGGKVAMVGDGINDAPALARADVGMAIGAGTDIAIEAADVVLIKSDLLDVVTSVQLSRAVMRNIRQNLFWAFFYNAAGIPLAAGLFYSVWGLTLNPMIAAAAMSLSSVSVVTNALRLRLFKPHYSSPLENQQIMNTIIRIEGMNCAHCSAAVQKALMAVPGVTDVSVDLSSKTARVESRDGTTCDMLTAAVGAAGYRVVETH